MDNLHNGDDNRPSHRSRNGRNIVTALATVAILGVASLSAYIMSGDTSVKPASGSAHAMSLATSDAATSDDNAAR